MRIAVVGGSRGTGAQLGLDWTIVRPTGLTDKPATGAWRALEPSQEGKLGGTITRADLAAFMLQALTDDATIGSAVGISN